MPSTTAARPEPNLQHNSLQLPILDANALRKLATEPNSSKFAIDAHNRAITEIRDLSELPKLCSLDVSFNRLTSLKNVHTAKELRELRAYNNKLLTLRFLKGNGNLEGLLVHENQLDEIAEDLLALVKLKTLWLNGNRLTKVEHLGACRLLVHLDLSRNRITRVAAEGLESLSSLEYLNLSGNRIASTGNLTHLTKLEELNLSSNRIATLDGGLLPANLSVLRLNDNQLTSLQSFPPYLTKLNELYLQDNAITDIGENSNTTKFPELESLDLRNNRIRMVAQLKAGLAGYAALADLWIQGNPCCLSQSYLLEIVQALPELRTLDNMTDTQLKAQMEALRTGVITQDALLATMARPMTPLSGRPGSASSSRPITPRSADSSRPVTPDRGAPVFQKPSSRAGALLKIAKPEELEKAQLEVAERLKTMKAMLARVGKDDVAKKGPAASSTRSKRTNEAKPTEKKSSFQTAARRVERKVDDNQLGEASRKKSQPVSDKPRSRGIDAGTDPLESLVGHRHPTLSRSIRANTPETITPRRAMETQTPRDPVVVLPPAPVSVSKSQSIATSTLVDAAAMMTMDNQTKDEADGDAIEREMKQLLMAYATPRDDRFPDGEPHDDSNGHDPESGESPRIVTNKTAEQRLPPNPRSRQGYKAFRIPTRLVNVV